LPLLGKVCLGYNFRFVRGPRVHAAARQTGFQGFVLQTLKRKQVVVTNPGIEKIANFNWRKGTRKALPDNKETTVNKLFLSAALATASLIGAATLGAQSAPAAGTAVPGKVGVLNVRQAIIATSEGKQASGELQGQFTSRQTELENMNKQLNDIRQRLQANSDKLSPEEAARLERQGTALQKQIQRKQEDYQEDVNASQQEVIDRIGRKMMDVLDRYARENSYIAIFDSSAQGAPIYVSNGIDVTADIIKLYDQAYPAKAGTGAAKPAAAKPAGPTTAKPVTSTPKP
jgi:outer membrane protein